MDAQLLTRSMKTYEKQIPQQGANMNQQKELKLICTTLYKVLHLDVATPEVATNLLMHMTFTLGLKIVGANKIPQQDSSQQWRPHW